MSLPAGDEGSVVLLLSEITYLCPCVTHLVEVAPHKGERAGPQYEHQEEGQAPRKVVHAADIAPGLEILPETAFKG